MPNMAHAWRRIIQWRYSRELISMVRPRWSCFRDQMLEALRKGQPWDIGIGDKSLFQPEYGEEAFIIRSTASNGV